MKNIAADIMLIGLSASFLWHFSNIWRYGNHSIEEPNIVILGVETAGLLFILAFSIAKSVNDLNREKR